MSPDEFAMAMCYWDGKTPDNTDKLEEFTKEITRSEPDYVKKCRIEYLEGEIMKVYKRIHWWLGYMTKDWWWNEAIIESVINPLWEKAEKLEKEISFYQKPIQQDYDKITEYDIERASQVDCSTIMETHKKGCINFAVCPFHEDRNPSMACYSDHYHCFTCGAHGNAIHLVRKLYNLSFIEAVNQLKGG